MSTQLIQTKTESSFEAVNKIYPGHVITSISEVFAPGQGWVKLEINFRSESTAYDSLLRLAEKGYTRVNLGITSFPADSPNATTKYPDFSLKELLVLHLIQS